jgi:2-methylcitrate dehydratase PrpD
MVVEEDPGYTSAFLDPTVRACANSIQITFQDGSCTERVEILQPIGHASRRTEGLPYLRRKLERNLALTLPDDRTRDILATFEQGWRRALPLRAFLHPFCASQ